jgi:hypothetical protein
LSTTSNDTYSWGIGSGIDTIQDLGGSLDHVDFLAGTSQSQIRFARNANSLELSLLGQSDKLTIKDWYLSSANQIEEFRFSDGSSLLASQVQSLVGAMAAFSAPASAGSSFVDMKSIGAPVSQLAMSSMM